MSLNFGQNLFPPRGEFNISYDYFDISNGTGYDIYYGAKGDDGEYIITTRKIPSEEIATVIKDQLVATSFTKYFDIDFDLLFNLPKNIKGNLLVSVPMGMSATDVTDKDFEFYCIVKAYHYDGSTETLLATGTSITSVISNLQTDVGMYSARTHLLKLNISTTKHFKKGETLRITIEGWFKTTEAGAQIAHLIIGHDPAGRIFTGSIPEEPNIYGEFGLANEVNTGSGGTIQHLSTIMQFHVPFRLDI